MRKLALPLTIAAALVAAGSSSGLHGSRLIAFESVPDAASCEWSPEEEAALAEAPQSGAVTPVAAVASDEVSSRKPLRWIQDPNPSFSSMFVDNVRNEVVILDANRFDILVFDRLTNTPASSPRSEPKRKIGGPKTLSQFTSTLHIDTANGDIYAVNNDSLRGHERLPERRQR
jgi:hypothetical protein